MYNDLVALDADIARLERQVGSGETTADLLLRLGQLYLRADRPRQARDTLIQAQEVLPTLIRTMDGEIAGIDPLHDQIEEALQRAQELAQTREESERREALTRQLERDGLAPDEHDELIRLEVAAGLTLHKQTPICPACEGPVAPVPPKEGEEAKEGMIRCARSGQDGDLCRHTDAEGLFACSTCGLVVRPWNYRRKLKPDPKEPPVVRPEKARCHLCGCGVADWRRHFLRCPKGRPRDFPRCTVCNSRGFHRRTLRCPRCRAQVGETPCMEKHHGSRR